MKNSTDRSIFLISILIGFSFFMKAQITINLETLEISGMNENAFKIGETIPIKITNAIGNADYRLEISYTSYDYTQNGLQQKFTSLLDISGTDNNFDKNTEITPDQIQKFTDKGTSVTTAAIDNFLSNRVHFKYDPDSTYSLRSIGKYIQVNFSELDFSDISKSILEYENLWKTKSEYYQLPIQVADADVSKITVKRYKKDDDSLVEERVYEYHNQGGFGKIDFSAGFFGTGLVNESFTLLATSINDTVYKQNNFMDTDTISAINQVSKNQIVKEDNGNYRIGIGILAHYHSRKAKWLNYGISIGFEIDSEVKVGYLLGFSALLGQSQRFVLTSGLALGQVNRLSSRYNEGDLISTDFSADQILIDRWDYKPFLGISYNF